MWSSVRGDRDPEYRAARFVQALALVFLIKAMTMALFVTPLWDVPDETGHYSYVRDIAEGRGLPLLNQSWIESDILEHLHGEPGRPRQANWIAQHPPVYYLIAAVPLRITAWFTDDAEILYRAPRVVAPVVGDLDLPVPPRTLVLAGVTAATAAVMASVLGFLPMYTHLASGTSHDVPLLLFSALATLAWVRFLLDRRLTQAYLCCLWLGLAAGTKLTALVLLAPMVATLIAEVPGGWRQWLRHGLGFSIAALAIPGLWLIRNLVHFGNPFATASSLFYREAQTIPLDTPFLDFLAQHPVIEHFMLNSFGLIGWMGTGAGRVWWFQVDGFERSTYSLLTFLAVAVLAACLVVRMIKDPPATAPAPAQQGTLLESVSGRVFHPGTLLRRPWPWLIAAGVLCAVAFAVNPTPQTLPATLRLLGPSLLLGAAVPALWLALAAPVSADRMIGYGVILFVFFAAVVLNQLYGIHLDDGRMRATHGRYFYPVFPALLLAVAMAFERLKVSPILPALGLLALAWLELSVFVGQTLPFYGRDW
jgi:hypothetical protein